MEEYADTAAELAAIYLPQLALALLVLIIGWWLAKRITNLTLRGMERSGTDETVRKFLGSLLSIALKALVLITVIGMVGVETTSFIAVLGAAGLAIGLALQGTLANFAGGVLIALFRPYRVGDVIDAQGVIGSVREIQIFNTVLTTPDNKVIFVPNGAVSNGIITNITMEDRRRVDFVFGIGYGDDIAKARGIIQRLIEADSRIHADPEPMIVVGELADSSVNFTVRVWTDTGDYWGVFFDLTEAVKLAFDADGVSIPFPQQDVHMISQD